MLARKDALFDLLDALVTKGPVTSFPMLSLSTCFQRKWPSLYAAIEDGRLDSAWIHFYLAQQIPAIGVQVFPLDGSAWARPRARTLDDHQYVYQPTQAVNGSSVCVGYPYSLLEWSFAVRSSWSLPIDIRRVSSTRTVQEVGALQVKDLAKARQTCTQALDIIAADGRYGNSGFLHSVKGQRCGVVVRLRRDRVLYRGPELSIGKRKPGRPRVHGERFAFKDPQTWGIPVEIIKLEDPYWGSIRLERWNQVHELKGADVPYDVVRACVHLEREKPPEAIWLAWQAPTLIPGPIQLTVETIWRSYHHRWLMEPGVRYRKQQLGWTMPQFHSKEAGDRWSELVTLAVWLLFLARPVVEDQPLPWQKPQKGLTPQRVQQSFSSLFSTIGTPARPAKTRGKASGWQKGKLRMQNPRFAVVKKQPVALRTA
ncbi:MAG: hypothetical protein A2Z14_15615 [Chloroflexi bacterium RBG_16_48_8]|nr:MAG: hypothetical protein A2Z14_15615 [Chloroflexi bacterium RBG_16_48_8]